MLRQRSPLTRQAPLRSRPVEAKVPVKRKKKCENPACGEAFVKERMGQRACSVPCAIEVVRLEKAKEERKLTREQKMAAKKPHYWAKRAEKQFNRFIRLRDAGDACISCGTYDAPVWHAGHMYTVKARPDLRYNEDNVHLQCPDCNTYNGGMVGEYKRRVVSKIGQERLDALVYVNPAFKKTREFYQAIEAEYKGKADALEKQRGHQ